MNTRLGRAHDFITRNARVLERRRFDYHFGHGSAGPVVAALAAYQNSDGGFGWGLEPDKRTPHSQPQDMEFALSILDEIGALRGPIVERAGDWLAAHSTSEGGVPYALPSTNEAPHAPWWGITDSAPGANINPTAAIVGLLLKHHVQHPWLEHAVPFVWSVAETTQTAAFHDIMPLLHFLAHVPDRTRAEPVLARIGARVAAPGTVALEVDATGYVQKPLAWAPFPESFCRHLFADDVIARHVAALARQQLEDGSWPISWEAISPGVALEWRGIITLQTLRTLRAYGVPLDE